MHVGRSCCVTNDVEKLWVSVLVACAACAGGEYALLQSGAVIYADRHAVQGETLRLYRGEGFIELPRSAVLRIEPGEQAPQPSPEPPKVRAARDPRSLVSEAAARYGGEDFAGLLHSVAKVESGYRPQAVSHKGARGLMQLMPETARRMGVDPDEPAENAEAGARLLRDLLLRYRDDPYQLRLALAAYNAGPGAVERYGGVPPYQETVRYVERVLSEYRRAQLKKPSSADH